MDIKEADLGYLKSIYNYMKDRAGVSKEELRKYLGISISKLERLLDSFMENTSIKEEDSKNSKYVKQDDSLFDKYGAKLNSKYSELVNSLDVVEAAYVLDVIKGSNTALTDTIDKIKNIVNYSLANEQKSLIKNGDNKKNKHFPSLVSSADLPKEQLYLRENIIDYLSHCLVNRTVLEIEYMKVPLEVPTFDKATYRKEYKLENKGFRFIEKMGNDFDVYSAPSTNNKYEATEENTYYVHEGASVIAHKGARVFAYNNSYIYASKGSKVVANSKAHVYAFNGAKIFNQELQPISPVRVLSPTKIFNAIVIKPFLYQGGKYSYIFTQKYDYPSKINLERVVKIKESKINVKEFFNNKNNCKVFNKEIYKSVKGGLKFSWKNFKELLIKWGNGGLVEWDKGRVSELELSFNGEWYNRYFINGLKRLNGEALKTWEYLQTNNNIGRKENSIILINLYYGNAEELINLFRAHGKIENPEVLIDAITDVCINSLTDPFGIVQGDQFTATIGFSTHLSPYIISRQWPESRIVKYKDSDGTEHLYERLDNGKCIMNIITSSDFELIRYLRALGKDAVLISTDKKGLREKIIKSSEDLVKVYTKTNIEDWLKEK